MNGVTGAALAPLRYAAILGSVLGVACQSRAFEAPQAAAATAVSTDTLRAVRPKPPATTNRFAYIPPQCYTRTRSNPGEAASNPCYACHVRPQPPNFVDDADLQLEYKLPRAAADNPWRNLFSPPWARAPSMSDAETLAYVRRSNYFDDDGRIALAGKLVPLGSEWDTEGDGHWDGVVPDAFFRFDERGFDHRPDGSATGWRAFAYYPFLGTFFPSNGSIDDVLIRLDPSLQQDADGRRSQLIYELNFAIVEALIARADIPIDGVDEAELGVDLDLDGRLGRATHVAFDARSDAATRMQYVGRARESQRAGVFPLAPGLFPLGTEFLHSVRYLDPRADQSIALAARMKELRYAKKVRWFSPADLRAYAAREVVEQAESADGAREILWEFDRGVYNGQGWLFQGFIEAADGSLRPQSYEESMVCAGCHGGIGATTDGIFSFPRKLRNDATQRGWFHWTQRDLRGLPEPRRRDGRLEYTLYLLQNHAGDELRENAEIRQRFFDSHGAPRKAQFARLHADVSQLLMPSPTRALALDRAYRAIVREQAFNGGREAVLAPSTHVYARAPLNARTGVPAPIAGPQQARGAAPTPRLP